MSAPGKTRPATIVRPARPDDAAAVAAIYGQGIAERQATFRTEPPRASALAERIASGRPFVVAERGGEPVGWAAVGEYNDGCIYGNVGELAVYVERSARGTGAGRALVEAACEAAERAGLYKLIGLAFTTNAASAALLRSCGFREVGVHRRHGRLEGEWRDVLVVERLLGEAGR